MPHTLDKPTQSQKENDPKQSPDVQKQHLANLEDEYKRTLSTFGKSSRVEKERLVTDTFNTLVIRLKEQKSFLFSDREQATLKLKLARYFQREETIDTNTLFDALIESPNFIKKDKGGFHTLLEVHEQKTLIAIAEMRKKRAEMGDTEVFNPWENLFTTKSGKY